MARKKKVENEPSQAETVVAFLKRCFKDGEVMCIHPIFNETYTINGVEYKFTESVLKDMLDSGKVRVTSRSDKEVNIMGVIS
ncbi:hypothetical protein M5X00_26165 [Paenibacillus alvei]|uniref:hypothetical protein n=1 Tax=Paenibacillus alvei TaxID=44250 RepID=UPI000289EC92|nr:hypothetical protein [Paenibacillus alvei]EJW13898.1 hypothetical protein PAV_141p00040 [Paenibacillus alvei DSM 29]MCY9707736.1 hypothetical protein [Paenibacillus alvei]MCY9757717.1 hypothetical protein [Paenibacillus alvei]MEC0082751.1 hypothetical protein [Paenibacillus alvei]